jgi:BASS family bile acid:Na+ symporter
MDAFAWSLVLETIFVVGAMAYIGLSVSLTQVRELLHNRRRLALGLVANVVLVPLLALALIALFEMPSEVELALLLLGLAPGGMNVLQFTTKISGRLAHAAAALFVLTLVALVIMLVAVLFLPLPREPGAVSMVAVLGAVLAAVIAPMALGGFVRRHRPGLAKKLARPVNLVSTVAFVAAMVVGASVRSEASQLLSGTVIMVLALFVAGTLLIGWAMGGRDPVRRQFLATVTSIRNAGLVLLVALALYPNSGIDVVVLAYMTLMIPPNAVITIGSVIRDKRRQKKAAETPGA